jgi:hypothetical protein
MLAARGAAAMSGPRPTCPCQPPVTTIIARYSNAIYSDAGEPKGAWWECQHGRIWRAKRNLFTATVWRLLSPRQERRHRRREAR